MAFNKLHQAKITIHLLVLLLLLLYINYANPNGTSIHHSWLYTKMFYDTYLTYRTTKENLAKEKAHLLIIVKLCKQRLHTNVQLITYNQVANY